MIEVRQYGTVIIEFQECSKCKNTFYLLNLPLEEINFLFCSRCGNRLIISSDQLIKYSMEYIELIKDILSIL